jgi:DHA1 family inner membrane transport protein
VVLIVFEFTARSMALTALTILLFGAVGFATVPPFQARVMDVADGAPTLASAANIAAFNLGNAIGAWLGGLAIDAGLGYTAPDAVGALLATASLAVALCAGLSDRKSQLPDRASAPDLASHQ